MTTTTYLDCVKATAAACGHAGVREAVLDDLSILRGGASVRVLGGGILDPDRPTDLCEDDVKEALAWLDR